MIRREALSSLSFLAGGSLLVPSIVLSACRSDNYQNKFFSNADTRLLNEIADVILPETKNSPGAKELKVGNFMDTYVADCFTIEHQKVVQKGLVEFEQSCFDKMGASFEKINRNQRHEFLTSLDAEAKGQKETLSASQSEHYFEIIKSLVLFAYFTSNEGATKALRYLTVPGKYDGHYALEEGDKSWAL